MAFHYKDNWFFERLNSEGDVRIYREEKESDSETSFPGYEFCIDIDAASWASIVASVSKLGETSETYHKIIAYHQGDLS